MSFFCLSLREAINEVFRATIGKRLRLEVVNKVPDKRLYSENLLPEISLKEILGDNNKKPWISVQGFLLLMLE